MINNPIKISSLHRSFFFTKPSKHQSFDHHSICEPTKFPSPFAVPASDLKNRGILKNNTVMAVSRGKKHRDGQSNLGNKLYILIYIYISHRIHGAAIYGNIYHQYTPNVSIYTIHGSYGWGCLKTPISIKWCFHALSFFFPLIVFPSAGFTPS